MSRTRNSLKNTFFGFVNKAIAMISPFIIRYVMIRTMGAEYLGINGLFTSILQLLNLTELGLSSAIVYSLYKPIADDDEDTVNRLLNFYKKAYRLIGICILAIGIILLPFLDKLISGTYPEDINIRYVFCFYLFNSSFSYLFFAYRSCILIANQRSDIKSNINSVARIFEFILQLFVVLVIRDYYLYIVIHLITTVAGNITTYFYTQKMYPQYKPRGSLRDGEGDMLKKQVLGLMADKVCSVSRNAFDSVFVSAFFGLSMVAIYENYSYIANAMFSLIIVATSSLTASVGNAVVTKSKAENYKDMNELMFIFSIVYGCASICYICLIQPFISLWVGEGMKFPIHTAILFSIYFYFLCMGIIRSVYVQATGIWWHEKNRAIAETVLNLVLNVILIQVLGIEGVILGTLISLFFVNYLYGSKYLFKYYFVDESVLEYHLNNLRFLGATLVAAIPTVGVCYLIKFSSDFLTFVIRLIACVIIVPIMYFVLFKKTKYWDVFLSFKNKILKNISRK